MLHTGSVDKEPLDEDAMQRPTSASSAAGVRQLLSAGEAVSGPLLVRSTPSMLYPDASVTAATGSVKNAAAHCKQSSTKAAAAGTLWATFWGVGVGPLVELFASEHAHSICGTPVATLAAGPGGQARVVLATGLPPPDPERGVALAVLPTQQSLEAYVRRHPDVAVSGASDIRPAADATSSSGAPVAGPICPALSFGPVAAATSPDMRSGLSDVMAFVHRRMRGELQHRESGNAEAEVDNIFAHADCQISGAETEGQALSYDSAVMALLLDLTAAATVRLAGDAASPGSQQPLLTEGGQEPAPALPRSAPTATSPVSASADPPARGTVAAPPVYISFPGGLAQRLVWLSHITHGMASTVESGRLAASVAVPGAAPGPVILSRSPLASVKDARPAFPSQLFAMPDPTDVAAQAAAAGRAGRADDLVLVYDTRTGRTRQATVVFTERAFSLVSWPELPAEPVPVPVPCAAVSGAGAGTTFFSAEPSSMTPCSASSHPGGSASLLGLHTRSESLASGPGSLENTPSSRGTGDRPLSHTHSRLSAASRDIFGFSYGGGGSDGRPPAAALSTPERPDPGSRRQSEIFTDLLMGRTRSIFVARTASVALAAGDTCCTASDSSDAAPVAAAEREAVPATTAAAFDPVVDFAAPLALPQRDPALTSSALDTLWAEVRNDPAAVPGGLGALFADELSAETSATQTQASVRTDSPPSTAAPSSCIESLPSDSAPDAPSRSPSVALPAPPSTVARDVAHSEADADPSGLDMSSLGHPLSSLSAEPASLAAAAAAAALEDPFIAGPLLEERATHRPPSLASALGLVSGLEGAVDHFLAEHGFASASNRRFTQGHPAPWATMGTAADALVPYYSLPAARIAAPTSLNGSEDFDLAPASPVDATTYCIDLLTCRPLAVLTVMTFAEGKRGVVGQRTVLGAVPDIERIAHTLARGGASTLMQLAAMRHAGRASPHRPLRNLAPAASGRALQCSGTIERRPACTSAILRGSWTWTRMWVQLVGTRMSFFSTRSAAASSENIELSRVKITPMPAKRRAHVLRIDPLDGDDNTTTKRSPFLMACSSEHAYVRWLDAMVEAGARYEAPVPPPCCLHTPFVEWCTVQACGLTAPTPIAAEDEAQDAASAREKLCMVYTDGPWLLCRKKMPATSKDDNFEHAVSLVGATVAPAPGPGAPWRVAVARGGTVLLLITPPGPLAGAALLHEAAAIARSAPGAVGDAELGAATRHGPETPALAGTCGKKAEDERAGLVVRAALRSRLISTENADDRALSGRTCTRTTFAEDSNENHSSSENGGLSNMTAAPPAATNCVVDTRATIAQLECGLVAETSFTGAAWTPLTLTVTSGTHPSLRIEPAPVDAQGAPQSPVAAFRLQRGLHGVVGTSPRSLTIDWLWNKMAHRGPATDIGPERSFLWARFGAPHTCELVLKALNLALVKSAAMLPAPTAGGSRDDWLFGHVDVVGAGAVAAGSTAGAWPSPPPRRRSTALFADIMDFMTDDTSEDDDSEDRSDDDRPAGAFSAAPRYTGAGRRGYRLAASPATTLVPLSESGADQAVLTGLEARVVVLSGTLELRAPCSGAGDALTIVRALADLVGVPVTAPAMRVSLSDDSSVQAAELVAAEAAPSAEFAAQLRTRLLATPPAAVTAAAGLSAAHVVQVDADSDPAAQAAARAGGWAADSNNKAAVLIQPAADGVSGPALHEALLPGGQLGLANPSGAAADVLAAAGIAVPPAVPSLSWVNLRRPIVLTLAAHTDALTLAAAAAAAAVAAVTAPAEVSFAPGAAQRVYRTLCDLGSDGSALTVPGTNVLTNTGVSEADVDQQRDGLLSVQLRSTTIQASPRPRSGNNAAAAAAHVASPMSDLDSSTFSPAVSTVGRSPRISVSSPLATTPATGLSAPGPLSPLGATSFGEFASSAPPSPLGDINAAVAALTSAPVIVGPSVPPTLSAADAPPETAAGSTEAERLAQVRRRGPGRVAPSCTAFLAESPESVFDDDPFWVMDSRISVNTMSQRALRLPRLFKTRRAPRAGSTTATGAAVDASAGADTASYETSPLTRPLATPGEPAPPAPPAPTGPPTPGWIIVGIQFRASPGHGLRPCLRLSHRGEILTAELDSAKIRHLNKNCILITLGAGACAGDELLLRLPCDAFGQLTEALQICYDPAVSASASMSGWLLKMGGSRGGRRNWKRRWVSISDGILTYAEHPDGRGQLGSMVLWRASVDEVDCEKEEDVTRPPRDAEKVFRTTDAAGRTLYLAASDACQSTEWVNGLKLAAGFGVDAAGLLWAQAPGPVDEDRAQLLLGTKKSEV